MTLPNISSQMEVGTLEVWPGAAGTLEHWMCNIPTAHPVQTLLSISLWQASHTTSGRVQLSTPTYLIAVLLQAAPWENILFAVLFFVSLFLSGALRTCNPETHSSVQCAMPRFYCLCVRFHSKQSLPVAIPVLGKQMLPSYCSPMVWVSMMGQERAAVTGDRDHSQETFCVTLHCTKLFLNAAVAPCEGAIPD